MSVIKIKTNNVIGIDEEDIAFIYKYGVVFLDGTEMHFPQYWIKKYIDKNDLHHLYLHDICG
tara:strand:+ start:3472 stop:3657 length:186 start_codon:yes stop_codon:yes gene_type:complete